MAQQLCASEALALQREELDALQCIYPDLLRVVRSDNHSMHLAVNITSAAALESCCQRPPASWQDSISVHFHLNESYPQSPVVFSLEVGEGLSMMEFSIKQRKSLLRRLGDSATEGAGGPALFSIIGTCQEWLSSAEWSIGTTRTTAEPSDDNAADCDDDNNATAAADDECPLNRSGRRRNPINYSVQREADGDGAEIEMESMRIRMAIDAAEAYAGGVSSNNSTAGSDSSSSSGYGSKGGGGVWNVVVGLIGKPSAGKSTFFNAVTKSLLLDERKLAAVAAHPFTTIDPNVSQALFSSADNDADRIDARHGRGEDGRRLLPLVVKDVAGLVPGAYQGKGKGNKFLNDLCEADALVHIIDATGNSDESGNIYVDNDDEVFGRASDPLHDHRWIKEELHRWVSGNIRSKWHSVSRLRAVHPEARGAGSKVSARVRELFTGYQGGRVSTMVCRAAGRAGLDLEAAEQWDSQQLHLLVAHYLCLRFPICLALNKIDAFRDAEYGSLVVQRCRAEAARRGELAVPVSALCAFRDLENAKRLRDGGGDVEGAAEGAESTYIRLQQSFPSTAAERSFGVMTSISAAVYLKSPVLVYPVQDLETEAPVGWSDNQHGRVPALQDCLLLRPGSIVYELYEALKRGALGAGAAVLQGDFVRAEGRGLHQGSKRIQLSKDSVINSTNCVIRIDTNRKARDNV